MSRSFPISSPVRAPIGGVSGIASPSRNLSLSGALAIAGSSMRGDGTLGTVFMLVSVEDPTDPTGARRVVTPASFSQFLTSMRVTSISFDAVSELIIAAARASPTSRSLGGRLATLSGGRNSSLAHSDEVALSEADALLLLEAMPNTVSILLDRCELLAEMAEHPLAAAKADEALRVAEQSATALEEDRHRLQQEMDAVLRKAEALEAVPEPEGASADGAASASEAGTSSPRSAGSPTLRDAEAEQRQRLAGLKVSAGKAADLIEALTNQLQAAVDVHVVRERAAEEADAALKGTERRLWEHTAAMLEVEEAYLAAKAKFDQAKELQRELNREKTAQQEAAERARELLVEAQSASEGLERDIMAARSDLELNLSVEIRETTQIVQSLEAATRSTAVTTRRERQIVTLRNEHKALQARAESVASRAEATYGELEAISEQRAANARVAARHEAWASGPSSEQSSKAFEDSVLAQEFVRAIARQSRAADEAAKVQRDVSRSYYDAYYAGGGAAPSAADNSLATATPLSIAQRAGSRSGLYGGGDYGLPSSSSAPSPYQTQLAIEASPPSGRASALMSGLPSRYASTTVSTAAPLRTSPYGAAHSHSQQQLSPPSVSPSAYAAEALRRAESIGRSGANTTTPISSYGGGSGAYSAADAQLDSLRAQHQRLRSFNNDL